MQLPVRAQPRVRLPSQLRVLIFDDDAIDAELIRRALARRHCRFQVRHILTEQEYLVALRSFSPHVIVSDYKLPLYGGAFALKMARELCPEIPFILVSGVLQDGLATELLKRGARAFVSKNHLDQLGPMIEQALAGANHPAPAEPLPQPDVDNQPAAQP